MSLKAQEYVVPEETAELARAIFPKGNLVMNLYDELGVIFEDKDFADLYPSDGQPAISPVRLALATLLQFREGLTDRQAAEAVKTKIDWKYLLCLELKDKGFHHTVLSEFRTRLLSNQAEQRLFEKILKLAKGKGLVKAGGQQRIDSTHVLAAMRAMTRMECVTEILRHALNVLAEVNPEWLLVQTKPDWLKRYGPRASDYRLPKSETKRLDWVNQTGQDGYDLLYAIYSDEIRRGLTWLTVVSWKYNGSKRNGMPESEVNDEMIRLEDALEVLDERTSESLFAYTATGNGIKEFVFYISDRDQFLESFNTALSDHPRYPIEINFYQDENWQDLRKLISDFSGGS